MSPMSTSTLSVHLVTFKAATAPFSSRALTGKGKPPMAEGFGISDETYGRNSFLYISTPDVATRLRLESFLESKGAKVDRSYSPGSCTTEVAVSYFKGWHHDE